MAGVIERRAAGALAMAAPGRRLQGVCLRYGDTARIGNVTERFAPGALIPADRLMLNLEHNPRLALCERGALAIEDEADEVLMQATVLNVPIGDQALADVKSGRMTGLSIEFQSEAEHQESGVRVITRAALVGVAVVASPAYDTSVEARNRAPVARRRVWL